MGCAWKTIRGRRVRVGAAAPSRPLTSLEIGGLLDLLAGAGIKFVSLSPEVAVEELRDAVLRIWHDPETGYMAEVRTSPTAPPVYHKISDQEARLLQARRPPPQLMARLFAHEEPGVE